jgi:DNA-binding transcriptional LysR family regulator
LRNGLGWRLAVRPGMWESGRQHQIDETGERGKNNISPMAMPNWHRAGNALSCGMHAAVLRYFDEVARLGSIRRAAEVLNVASSAVNRQILKLEREIGAPLFERRRDGVRLTAAGEVMVRHARETLREFDRSRAEIARLGGSIHGHVRIISLESLIVRFMPRVVAELMSEHPGLSMTVIVVDPSQVGEELRSGRNDFGVLFVDERHRDFDVAFRFRTAIGAVMRPDHPLAQRRSVTLTDCAAYPVATLHDRWLLDAIMATEFARSGARLEPRIVSNSIDFMRVVIEEGLGIGFFTPVGFKDEIERGRLVHVPLAEAGLRDSEVGILVPRDRSPSPPAKVVLEHVKQRLAEFTAALPKRTRGR